MTTKTLRFEGCIRQEDGAPHISLIGEIDDEEIFRIILDANDVRAVHKHLSAEFEDTKKCAASFKVVRYS